MAIVDSAISFYIDSYTKTLEEQASFGEDAVSILSLAEGGSTQSNLFSVAISAMIDNVLPIMQGVAIAIALLYCFIGIIGLAKSDSLTPETLIKQLSKFAVGFGVIMASKPLCYLFINLGEFVMRVISTLGVEPPDLDPDAAGTKVYVMKASLEEMFSVIKSLKYGGLNGTGGAILLYLSAVGFGIQWLVGQIANIVIFFAALTRGLELGVRSVFMPVAVASFGEGGGWNGAGGRFIKRFLAVCTQGAVIIGGVKVTRMFVSAQYEYSINESLNYAKQAAELVNQINNSGGAFDYTADVAARLAKENLIDTGIVTQILNDPSSWKSYKGEIGDWFSQVDSTLWSAVAMDINPGYAIVCQFHSIQSKAIWTTIAVTFAGLGLVAKALQVSNDVWGA